MSAALKYISLPSFQLESGDSIQELKLAYHTYGEINKDKSNVVWVFHPLSANSDVLEWWGGLFSEGNVFDISKYHVICVNAIGSPYGSTKPEDLFFPSYTMRDVVNAHTLVAEKLGIKRVFAAIGGSFGGNQALEFTYSFQGRVDNLILMASSAKESAWAIAVHESQRIALKSDPTFGQPGGGEQGMKAARAAALLNYRTSEVFITEQTDDSEKFEDFKAASYIQYQGDKFVKRFDALSYHYLMKCLDSHNLGRGRGGEVKALQNIDVPTLVIGIKTDSLVPVRLQRILAEHIPNSKYVELNSEYGHDAFLVEYEFLNDKITRFLENSKTGSDVTKRRVLKFGGKSLANGENIEGALDIIRTEIEKGPIALVVSARGDSTDRLLNIYNKAVSGVDYKRELDSFFSYQVEGVSLDLSDERKELESILGAISTLGSSDHFAFDRVQSFGEVISVKYLNKRLLKSGIDSVSVDAREIFHTTLQENDEFAVDFIKSRKETAKKFNDIDLVVTPVVTGFIASSENNKTVTLGRNGSNYSATLLASFIGAKEVQNWTDVPGVYSANPKFVSNAVHIDHMSYREANELANFGTNILHPKTILPLMRSDIPLVIKSSKEPNLPGTVIDKKGADKGIKAVSVIEDVALICIEGRGLLGNVGIDGRIFSALSKKDISVRLISQASSERGIGFVVNKVDAQRTELLLQKEFEDELKEQAISDINVNKEIAIVAIVGRHNYSLEKAISGLRRNGIWMHLISNSISGEHISLVVDNKNIQKAVKVIHNSVFGATKTVNVVAFGKGVVGGELVNQIVTTSDKIEKERGLRVNVVGVADSQRFVFNETGLTDSWKEELAVSPIKSDFESIQNILSESTLENVVIVDNTASIELPLSYPAFVKKGYDVVASNKKGNSIEYAFYKELRDLLALRGKRFYYETNVGAGLPIIDTIKHLYHSSDKVTKIRGVFSGSLSYLFNNFSEKDVLFSEVLLEARDSGYTEPDPREDLCGMDVARKLIILAREVGMTCEMEDVEVQNLVPEQLQSLDTYEEFIREKATLDEYYGALKSELDGDTVLRYIGELDVASNSLKVELVEASKDSPLGSIKNADAIIEIFTEGYGDQPIVVQGAGAGANVTARGVYSDILKVGKQM